MADTVTERRACALLTRLFEKRGYTIERNVPFRDLGVTFDCDGWDRKAKVGFEFLSSQHADHDDLSLAEYQTLMDAQQRGRLHLLILDEVETLTVAELTAAANAFLDELAAAPAGGIVAARTPASAKGKSAPVKVKPASAKRNTVRSAGGKPAAGKRAKPAVAKGAASGGATSRAKVGRAGAGKKAMAGKPAGTVVKGKRALSARSGRVGR